MRACVGGMLHSMQQRHTTRNTRARDGCCALCDPTPVVTEPPARQTRTRTHACIHAYSQKLTHTCRSSSRFHEVGSPVQYSSISLSCAAATGLLGSFGPDPGLDLCAAPSCSACPSSPNTDCSSEPSPPPCAPMYRRSAGKARRSRGTPAHAVALQPPAACPVPPPRACRPPCAVAPQRCSGRRRPARCRPVARSAPSAGTNIGRGVGVDGGGRAAAPANTALVTRRHARMRCPVREEPKLFRKSDLPSLVSD